MHVSSNALESDVRPAFQTSKEVHYMLDASKIRKIFTMFVPLVFTMSTVMRHCTYGNPYTCYTECAFVHYFGMETCILRLPTKSFTSIRCNLILLWMLKSLHFIPFDSIFFQWICSFPTWKVSVRASCLLGQGTRSVEWSGVLDPVIPPAPPPPLSLHIVKLNLPASILCLDCVRQ